MNSNQDKIKKIICCEGGCWKKINKTTNDKCKSCDRPMCVDCYCECNFGKSSTWTKGQCNACLWFYM